MNILVTHAMHAITWTALRLTTPLRAHALAQFMAARLPPVDAEDAKALLEKVSPWGSCLSQALTVASRLPGARVAIGVTPGGSPFGHAWVECNGAPLRPTDPRGFVIARLQPVRTGEPSMC
jgi:hypothetical protein